MASLFAEQITRTAGERELVIEAGDYLAIISTYPPEVVKDDSAWVRFALDVDGRPFRTWMWVGGAESDAQSVWEWAEPVKAKTLRLSWACADGVTFDLDVQAGDVKRLAISQDVKRGR